MGNNQDYYRSLGALYHGTTKSFLDASIEEHGKLKNREALYLDSSMSSCMGIAYQRARQYQSEPMLLAINTKLILPRLFFNDYGQPQIGFLNPNEYASKKLGENIDIVPLNVKLGFMEKFGFFDNY
jgi:hypothetical protein